MRDDVAWIKLDFDLVLGFADFDAPADPGDRNRVTAGVQGDVAFDIDDALMQSVDLRNPDRERFEMRAFDGEQFAGNRTDGGQLNVRVTLSAGKGSLGVIP